MMKLLNLTTDELKRAKGFYFLLMAFVLVTEGIMIFGNVRASYKAIASGNTTDYRFPITNLASAFDDTMAFTMIIGATGFALLAYAVFSWIRDWHFQGNFIYRLLSLPGNRAPIAYAKLISTLIMMAGILILQLAIFYVANTAFSMMFADSYTTTPVLIQIATKVQTSLVLFPPYPGQAFLIYGGGLWFLFTLMNSMIILLSAKGYTWARTIITIVIYWLVSIALVYLMGFSTFTMPLTASEATIIVLVFIYAANVINGYMMSWLMNHYISV